MAAGASHLSLAAAGNGIDLRMPWQFYVNDVDIDYNHKYLSLQL